MGRRRQTVLLPTGHQCPAKGLSTWAWASKALLTLLSLDAGRTRFYWETLVLWRILSIWAFLMCQSMVTGLVRISSTDLVEFQPIKAPALSSSHTRQCSNREKPELTEFQPIFAAAHSIFQSGTWNVLKSDFFHKRVQDVLWRGICEWTWNKDKIMGQALLGNNKTG